MTLLVALKGANGLVLAADSRGTFGDPRGATAQNDSQQKAHVLAEHVAVLAAGSGEIGAMVIDEVRKQVETENLDWATPVANKLRDCVRQRYNEWFPTVMPIPPMAAVQAGQIAARPDLAFIVGGYEHDGTPRLLSLPSSMDFPLMLHDYGFAVQGMGQYALYLLNRLYQNDRNVEELTALAVYVITETASQDGKVGGPVNVITIAPGADGCQLLPADSVKTINEENQRRSEALRDSFYEKD